MTAVALAAPSLDELEVALRESAKAMQIRLPRDDYRRLAELVAQRVHSIPNELTTLIDAAERLGTSPAVLRQAVARGSLATVKIGRDHFVTIAEIDRYGRDHRRGWTQPGDGALEQRALDGDR